MSRIDRVRILLVSVGMYGQKYLAEATGHDVGGDVAGIVDVAENLAEKFPVIAEKAFPSIPACRRFLPGITRIWRSFLLPFICMLPWCWSAFKTGSMCCVKSPCA